MAEFKRIFELENNEQVVVTVEQDDEQYALKVRTDFLRTCEAQITLTLESKKTAMKALAGFSQKDAADFRDKMNNMLFQ